MQALWDADEKGGGQMKVEDQDICHEPGCGLEMLWLPEIGFFCRNAKDHELAALRSKCEELEKRNEELEKESAEWAKVAVSQNDGFTPRIIEDGNRRYRVLASNEAWRCLESRAQEAETKLRAAEDQVVVLTEALHGIVLHTGFLYTPSRHVPDYIWRGKKALSNTAALAAQRKREIAEAAAKAEREHIRAVLIDGWMTADSFDAAILNPEGPDANTEDQ